MALQNATIRLFIQIGESSPDAFSKATKKARNNADDSFIYGGIVFTVGERGSVYTDIDTDQSISKVAAVCGRRIRWCRINAEVSQVHALTQSGHYTGYLLGYDDRLRAVVDKTGQITGKPSVIIEGAPVNHVLELATLIATGEIAIKLNGEVVPIDQPG